MVISYLTSIMSGSKRGAVAVLLSGVFRMLSVIYAAGVRMVWFGYNSGIRRVHIPPVAVVSVGNLTLGGTGKTPMVVCAVEHFLSLGRKPAVLTRGYGNDECRMLAEALPEVPVYKGQDRYKNALRASRDGRDVVILDDGFQHRRIGRDLNILLVDGRNLFGNGLIFPGGMLREPVSAAGRADIVVVTKTDGVTGEKLKEIKNYIGKIAPGKPVAISRHEPVSFSDVKGTFYGLETLKGRDICAVSGIADPSYFEDVLKEIGCGIVKKYYFPDHYGYEQKNLTEIAKACSSAGIRTIVTTAKDFVKMRDLDISGMSDKVLVLNVKMKITEGKEQLSARFDSVFSRCGS